ncbi:MAG: hypothetical protein M3071_17925 [Actinomycetota bacterium]|nr:hypothetical protein [Actinomycetota bacterium]
MLEREYHGCDSVIRVRPDCVQGGPSVILARISRQVPDEVGSPASVTVEGPVVAWCVEPERPSIPAAP